MQTEDLRIVQRVKCGSPCGQTYLTLTLTHTV